MYDPTVGRWLSLDPIGFEGNDTNLYRYVGNEPVTHIDPTGFVEIKTFRYIDDDKEKLILEYFTIKRPLENRVRISYYNGQECQYKVKFIQVVYNKKAIPMWGIEKGWAVEGDGTNNGQKEDPYWIQNGYGSGWYDDETSKPQAENFVKKSVGYGIDVSRTIFNDPKDSEKKIHFMLDNPVGDSPFEALTFVVLMKDRPEIIAYAHWRYMGNNYFEQGVTDARNIGTPVLMKLTNKEISPKEVLRKALQRAFNDNRYDVDYSQILFNESGAGNK